MTLWPMLNVCGVVVVMVTTPAENVALPMTSIGAPGSAARSKMPPAGRPAVTNENAAPLLVLR